MARSLNRVQLIGNLTRDPELRYTPNGTAVCSFGLATNRSWKTDAGEKHDEAEFHNIVAWNKLAELCSQFLVKGRKVYLEGRLSTRNWTAQDGTQRNRTEIVISDMILLDSRRPEGEVASPKVSEAEEEKPVEEVSKEIKKKVKDETAVSAKGASEPTEEVAPDDIPF
ncbi:MAG: single-stranded DNA-binding protein [Candidatus Levybacteria bacterium]|nr:single-stranded DNA-binding protein [Candidatus Levybacteria bacterium]